MKMSASWGANTNMATAAAPPTISTGHRAIPMACLTSSGLDSSAIASNPCHIGRS